MSLLDGLKTAQFTLQVSRTASHAYSRAAAKHKDESTDPTRGEISALVDQISAQVHDIRSTVATSRLAMQGTAAHAVATPPQQEHGSSALAGAPAPGDDDGGAPASSHRARTVLPAPEAARPVTSTASDARKPTLGRPRDDLDLERDARSVIEREQLRKRRRMRDASERRLAEYVRDGGLRAGYLLLRARAREAFDRIDTNGDGQLDVDEIKLMFEQLALDAGAAEDAALLTLGAVREMVDEFDDDGDGALGLDELCKLLAKYQAEHSSEAQLELRRRSSSARAAAAASEAKEAFDDDGSVGAYADVHRQSQARAMLANSIMKTRTKRERRTIGQGGKYVVHPLSEFHQMWDVFMTFLISTTVVSVPLALGWTEINAKMTGLNIAVDLIFCVDIVKNFHTGYFNENDVVVMDPRQIRRMYVQHWFVVDLFSSFPYELVLKLFGVDDGEEFSRSAKPMKAMRLLRIAKMMRLLRVSKVYRLLRRTVVEVLDKLKIKIPDPLVKFIKLGSGMLLLAHWIACLNFMVCRLAKTKPADGGPDAEFEFPSNSWVVNANLEHAPVGEQYAWALFKALCAMLMLGFEGPPFTNVTCGERDLWCTTEHWTVLVCLWIGAIFYALLVSSMTSIIASMNIARRQYEEKLAQVQEYMSFKKLPSALRDRVRQYFELKYSDGMVFEEETILADLTPNLQREIRRCLSSARLLKVPFIKSSPKLLMERVATCVEPLIVFADEVVVHEHHHGDRLFLINSGLVEISSGRTHRRYRSITDGCYFGDVAVLLDVRRTATCTAKMQTHLYTLHGSTLRDVLLDYPEVLEYMRYIARRRHLRVLMLDPRYTLTPEQRDEITRGEEKLFDRLDVDEEDAQTEIFQDPTTLATLSSMSSRALGVAGTPGPDSGQAARRTTSGSARGGARVAPSLAPELQATAEEEEEEGEEEKE